MNLLGWVLFFFIYHFVALIYYETVLINSNFNYVLTPQSKLSNSTEQLEKLLQAACPAICPYHLKACLGYTHTWSKDVPQVHAKAWMQLFGGCFLVAAQRVYIQILKTLFNTTNSCNYIKKKNVTFDIFNTVIYSIYCNCFWFLYLLWL